MGTWRRGARRLGGQRESPAPGLQRAQAAPHPDTAPSCGALLGNPQGPCWAPDLQVCPVCSQCPWLVCVSAARCLLPPPQPPVSSDEVTACASGTQEGPWASGVELWQPWALEWGQVHFGGTRKGSGTGEGGRGLWGCPDVTLDLLVPGFGVGVSVSDPPMCSRGDVHWGRAVGTARWNCFS